MSGLRLRVVGHRRFALSSQTFKKLSSPSLLDLSPYDTPIRTSSDRCPQPVSSLNNLLQCKPLQKVCPHHAELLTGNFYDKS